MKRLFIACSFLATSMMLSASLWAADEKISDATKATIEKSLLKARPDFAIERIEKSDIPNLFEVYFTRGGMVYSTATGSHILDGKLYKVEDGKLVDAVEEKLKPMRAKVLSGLSKDQMIVFSPEGETKAFVDVFTDVDCGYCQKLHSHIAEINKLGIEVRYLAFPRAGPNSISAKKLANAWCADDRKDALTKLKLRQNVPDKTCDNPVAAQYVLGEKLGVSGTPAVYTKDGSLIGGYLDPSQMAQVLGIQ